MRDPTMAAARPNKHIIARKKPRDRKGKYRTPPPAVFDISKLADDVLLSNYDVASVLRRSQSTPAAWRQDPTHPLGPQAWEVIDNKPLLRVRTLRAFMASRRTEGGKPKQEER